MMSFGTCAGPIIGLAPHHGEKSWFTSWWVRRYTCMHRLMHAGAPTLREPTSFKLNWLGCYNLSVSISFCGHTNTLWEHGPGTPCSTLGVLSPQDCHAFGLVPMCTIYWVVKSTSLEVHVTKGQDLPTHGAAPITIIGVPGWVPAENDMSGPICGLHVPPRLWPESSSVVMGNKESNDMLSVPRGLASWIETFSWTWQAVDLTLIQWC